MRNDTVKRRYIYGIGFRKREFAWAAPGREDHLYREDRLSSADLVSAELSLSFFHDFQYGCCFCRLTEAG